ncbi:type III secretion outer membrane pore, YscC/HrcC family [Burkholderia ambifaria IOP40-10]|uniref:Type 3 secretion system secretin n=1 Tax=Burkholderia ambifaria IOP40-10 TaxID=396596 RepID=B1FB85_9BURK|nr:type III secretion system outer membrane ring subunit SctC [Burkholderia ambifaria]EDT05167.1 type III secretion outer membrane pore, YscC/HrcC family [Burkholderia ambifaria IOP40-10]
MKYGYAARNVAVLICVCRLLTSPAHATPLAASVPPSADLPVASSLVAQPPAAPEAGAIAGAALDSEDPHEVRSDHPPVFVANDASLSVLANAIAARMHRAVVLSDRVRHKKVTGQFDLTHPRAVLEQLGNQMGLLSYDDGSSIYLYGDDEIKNAVVSMQHATVRNVRDFVRETHLLDRKFPIRGDDSGGTFYVTGAPIYVNLITAAAKYLDQMRGSVQTGKQVVKVVTLHNSFVDDRRYVVRDQSVDIPGMATVLSRIFGGQPTSAASPETPVSDVDNHKAPPPGPSQPAQPPFSLGGALPAPTADSPASSASSASSGTAAHATGIAVSAETDVRAVAYPDTNSIVLTGPLDKVQDMTSLIHSLDISKRQIQLSLWIIDIKKSCLDQLGVNWQGVFGSNRISGSFNGADNSTTLDGPKFLVSVMALQQKGDATIVSRPVLLTQENMPAVFDNNQTFYAKLIGERAVSLEHVTYGTMINVLPRLTDNGSEVEMQVDVEDGNATDTNDAASPLPLVDRTEIDTVARVPREKSLLIGGNTRDDARRHRYRIPGLASLPLIGGLFRWRTESHDQVVRVFLIQPKVLGAGASWRDGQFLTSGNVGENASLRSTVSLLRPYMEAK